MYDKSQAHIACEAHTCSHKTTRQREMNGDRVFPQASRKNDSAQRDKNKSRVAEQNMNDVANLFENACGNSDLTADCCSSMNEAVQNQIKNERKTPHPRFYQETSKREANSFRLRIETEIPSTAGVKQLDSIRVLAGITIQRLIRTEQLALMR